MVVSGKGSTTFDDVWDDIKRRVAAERPSVRIGAADSEQAKTVQVELEEPDSLRGAVVFPPEPEHRLRANKSDFEKVAHIWDKYQHVPEEISHHTGLDVSNVRFIVAVLDWHSDWAEHKRVEETEKRDHLVQKELWLARYEFDLEEKRVPLVQNRAGALVAAAGAAIALAVGFLASGGALMAIARADAVVAIAGLGAVVVSVASSGACLWWASSVLKGRKYWHPLTPEDLFHRFANRAATPEVSLQIDRTIAANLSEIAGKNRQQTEDRFRDLDRAVGALRIGAIALLVFLLVWGIEVTYGRMGVKTMSEQNDSSTTDTGQSGDSTDAGTDVEVTPAPAALVPSVPMPEPVRVEGEIITGAQEVTKVDNAITAVRLHEGPSEGITGVVQEQAPDSEPSAEDATD